MGSPPIIHPGKAFRHGDIEGVIAELAKAVGHGGGGGGLLEFAQSVLSAAASGGGGPKFSKEDVKRIYFVRSVQSIPV